MANPGKVFEEDFRTSAKLFPHVDLNRLNDPIGGQAGIRNICDFIVYAYPFIYYLELKSRQGNTLYYKDITSTQWMGLQEKAQVNGTIPGVLINFTDYNEAYFVHINDMTHLRDVKGKKSLHIDDCRQVGIKVPSKRKRVRFTYDVGEMLREVGDSFG